MKLKTVLEICWGIVLITIFALLLTNCAWNKPYWNKVQSEYPDCKDQPEPHIVLLEGGMYMPQWNVIFLCNSTYTWDTVEHEYRHACGDMQGETKKYLREFLNPQW